MSDKRLLLMGGYYYWANAVLSNPGSQVYSTSLFDTEVVPLPIDGEFIGLENNSQVDITLSAAVLYSAGLVPYSTFETMLERLNTRAALGWGQQKYNFIALGQSATTVDWAEPTTIDVVIENFGLIAKVAFEGKAEGIVYDAEPYAGCGIWNYSSMPQMGTYSFLEYQRFVYDGAFRIAQLWKGYFPNIKVLMMHDYAVSIDQQDITLNGNYGLYSAFLDGIYDGLGTPSTTDAGCIGSCSGAQVIMTDNSEWSYYDEPTMESEVKKLKGISDPRYKGKSSYYGHLTRYGYGLWVDLPGAGGGFPAFNNVVPSGNQISPDNFQTQMEYYLQSVDYLWIFNQYYNFHNSPQIINSQYNDRMQTVRTIFGMTGG